MSRYHSYIETAKKILATQQAGKPLALHLKSFFASDKKYGSRDRRTIAALCYGYYRTGKAFPASSVEEKILAGHFLCSQTPDPLLAELRPDLAPCVEKSLPEKMQMLGLDEKAVFPFASLLGAPVDAHAFTRSFFRQPSLFLRVRPRQYDQVIAVLNEASIPYREHSKNTIALSPNVPVGELLRLNRHVVVQDLNSQKVFDLLENSTAQMPVPARVWDCCAASGGKSILLFDKLNGKIVLTVSDIRANILQNLQKRLQQARVPVSNSVLCNLEQNPCLPPDQHFDIIICDVPCTGSGTWSRTPEQLYSFKQKSLTEYCDRQQKIISASLPHLARNGLFFYITCSVFEMENEHNVAFIQKTANLQCLQSTYLPGYELGADTMFVSVFQKKG